MEQKHSKPRKTKGDLRREQADIRACLEFLQPQAAKAGLREVAFWIGVARLAAMENESSEKK